MYLTTTIHVEVMEVMSTLTRGSILLRGGGPDTTASGPNPGGSSCSHTSWGSARAHSTSVAPLLMGAILEHLGGHLESLPGSVVSSDWVGDALGWLPWGWSNETSTISLPSIRIRGTMHLWRSQTKLHSTSGGVPDSTAWCWRALASTRVLSHQISCAEKVTALEESISA